MIDEGYYQQMITTHTADAPRKPCPLCGGTGKLKAQYEDTAMATAPFLITCWRCGGAGTVT